MDVAVSSQPREQQNETLFSPLFIILAIVLVVVGTVSVIYTWNESARETKEEARRLAQTAEAGIAKSHIPKLSTTPSDVDRQEYVELKKSLESIVRANDHVRFAYIFVQKNGKVYFLVDSEPVDSADYSPPGQEYWEADEAVYRGFQQSKTSVTKPSSDRWGTWISVLVPMQDLKTGEIIALFGMDFPAESWYDHATIGTVHVGVIFLSFIIILFVLYIVLGKNIELHHEKLKLVGMDTKLSKSEMLFRTVFEQSPIGIAIMHNDNDMHSNNQGTSINPMFEKITGRTKEELENTSWKEITHPDDLPLDLEYFEKFKSGQINDYDMEKRYIRPDGSVVWIHMYIVPLQVDHLKSDYHLCLIEDISRRKAMQKALFDSERSKAVLLSNLPGMAYRCNYDRQWTMQFVSEGCFELTGYHAESLLYNKELSFSELILPKYRECLWIEWERVLTKKKPFRHEYEIITATGKQKWVLEMGQGIFDEQGNVEALEGIVVDITQQKEREAQIQFVNEHDYVTGLYNRKFYEEAIRKSDNKDCLPLSVIVVDINGVRLINDAFGYAEGDKLLRETSKIIQGCCRVGDVLARIDGDEFGLIMPNTDNDCALETLSAIKTACASYNKRFQNRLYEVSLSIGCATKDTMDQNISETLKAAEQHLINRKLLNHKSFHSDLISSMMATVYEKSEETEEHSKRLAAITKRIGEKLKLSQKSLGELELLSMLHDIGKVGIDDRILKKPDRLTDDEWLIMKTHPEIGYRIAKSSSELETIAEYILAHHERWDGTGYPRGLKGENIPLPSRIVAVVDAYDAMTNDRIYLKAITPLEAMSEIGKHKGTQFDPQVVEVFEDVVSELGFAFVRIEED